jgi:N-acetylglucosaminyldiphosphoundecaprenol N-acetyl-beta-D-mannosaminyltransferase
MSNVSSPAISRLAGFPIAVLDHAGFIDFCQAKIEAGEPCWIVTLNLEMVSRCRLDPSYRELLSNADLYIADGMPLVWGSKLKRGTPRLPERLAGSDLTADLVRMVEPEKVAVIGGKDPLAALQRLGIQDSERAYIYSEKVDATEEQAEAFAAEINRRASRVVLLALGVPKQDRLAALFRPKLKQGLVLGVGGSFELIAGQLKRAPRWMQKSGLEWLFRLLQEPKRLAHRYLVVYWVGGFALAGDIVRSWFKREAL